METKKNTISTVLMLPWLAHGHISPFLELSKKLTNRNFHIYMCSTPVNLSSIKNRVTEKYCSSIELVEFHLPALPNLPPHYHTTNGLPAIGNFAFDEGLKRSQDIILMKTCKDFEGKYMDYLSSLVSKKIVPVGTLVKESTYKGDHEEIVRWLDKKHKGSTIFVSFGSECFLSKEEIHEVAQGLELSKVNFIWVIRFAQGERISIRDVLPEGFLERIKERGMVMEGWAPQALILQHASIGGFVSHCGWNSCTESMKFGVPIIAMPMKVDQPLNARLVEYIEMGIEVKRDENGKLQSEEIAKAIRKVVVEESGEAVRKKTKELSEKMNAKGDEEIDSVVEELVALCNNK